MNLESQLLIEFNLKKNNSKNKYKNDSTIKDIKMVEYFWKLFACNKKKKLIN